MIDFQFSFKTASGANGPSQVKSKLLQGIHKFKADVSNITDEELRAIIYQAYKDIYDNCPVKTGTTRDEHLHFREYGPGNYAVTCTTTKGPKGEEFNVILALEYGTKAHGPAHKKCLHFIIDGKEVFTKWVRGIPAHYFILKALMRTQAELSQLGAKVNAKLSKRA